MRTGTDRSKVRRSCLTWYGMQTILTHDVATVIEGDFEWDEDKALSNLGKHSVSFSEAATVFADTNLENNYDPFS